ncbi:hypothetical protein ACTQ46_04045 [Gallicola sp. Sow4_E12]|uniref:hypothetical protein n=1 Tax=Gallicola sp. Sow4_E12 TaxID=3438785 RepID=UPI003F8F279E
MKRKFRFIKIIVVIAVALFLIIGYRILLFQSKYPPREDIIVPKGESAEIMPGVKVRILDTKILSQEDYFSLTEDSRGKDPNMFGVIVKAEMSVDEGYYMEGTPLKNAVFKTEGYNNMVGYVFQDIKKNEEGKLTAVWPRGYRRIENGEKRIDYLAVPVGKWNVPDEMWKNIKNKDYTLTVGYYPQYIRMKLY